MLIERAITGIHECHCFQIVVPANLRLIILLDGPHQLRHSALKSIGKPHFFPAGLKPIAWLMLSRVIQRAGTSLRIIRPPDSSIGKSIGTLNPPLDVVISQTPFADGTCPDVIPGRGTKAVSILQNIKHDTIAVLEAGSRVAARTGVHSLRVAKQKPEAIQVMDAHIQQGQPVIVLQK